NLFLLPERADSVANNTPVLNDVVQPFWGVVEGLAGHECRVENSATNKTTDYQ
ncbi:906_t:CDS:2, partial [Dentiscutata heterogama]